MSRRFWPVASERGTFAVRPTSGADRGFVRRLTVAAFASYGDYDAIMDGWLSDPRTRTLVAELAGTPVGFAMWASRPGRPADVVLVSLALDPERLRRGLGLRLLTAAHGAIARETPGLSRCVSLDVAEDNLAARSLFAKAGYEQVPGPEGNYPAGQRAVRMVRELPPER